ncbi:PREDICTED: transcription initiation factor TFIID subunit 7-like isoform X2 [Chinchilla lanigera]|uniref:transcription initiation factor TFIID subunit 7-like isoform X2 n=1 Tax=Chinchilla lanigera TaxID=34839 RepID=UPI0006991F01|nr:PREDICTED: transcription initiation factor TFIID subunit 7-like isoform X2 [Chinchilla lanigera]
MERSEEETVNFSENNSTVASTSQEPSCQPHQIFVDHGAEMVCDSSRETAGDPDAGIPVNQGAQADADDTVVITKAASENLEGREAMSMSKSQDEPPHELENQFILRLPLEQACAVRNIMHSGGVSVKDKIKIDLASDGCHAVVQVEDVSLSAKLVDLPCVVESLKTFDKKNFYKTADISQMLVCSAAKDLPSPVEEPATSSELSVTRNKERDKKYIWKHGLTPPLKNVRKRRFRKTQKKYIESPDVEKEVKRLLCSDAEAVSARWEVIADDDTKDIESQGSIPGLPVSLEMSDYKQGDTSTEYDIIRELFSDSSSNIHGNEDEDEKQGEEDDDDDDDDDDDNDDEEDEEEEEDEHFEEALERELQAKITEYRQNKTKTGAREIVMEIQKNIHYKEKKLHVIQIKAQRQKNIFRKVENLALRNHLRCVLENLNIQEKQTNEQIASLKEKLNYFLKK